MTALSKFCHDVTPHNHDSWGYDHVQQCFNTAKEAEYPILMCQQYALVLQSFLYEKLLREHSARMMPQSQPKGRKVPQLIPEFLDVTTCLMDKVPAVDHKKNLMHAHGPIPAGSRLLRSEANKGNPAKFLCVFGIYRSMLQFVDSARLLWHPFDELRNLPDRMIQTLFINLTASPHQLTKLRCQFLHKWSRRAAALNAAEKELHSGMPSHVQRVMEGKRVLGMKELAEEMNWPDMSLFTEMCEGFKLVGTFEATGVFKPGVTVANLSAEEWRRTPSFCDRQFWVG